MNPVVEVLLALAALCALIAVAAWRFLREPAAETAQFDREIEQFGGSHDETTTTQTLPSLPPEDLVGTDDGDHPRTDARPTPDPSADPVSQDLPAAIAARGGAVADPAAGLTPAQRRRAVKKGRIPREVVRYGQSGASGAVASSSHPADLPSPAHQDEQREGGEPGHRSLTGLQCVPPRAPGRAGEFHPHAERIPRPMLVWDGRWVPVFPTLLESARHEAHFRQWETEMAADMNWALSGAWAAGFDQIETAA